MQFLILTDDEQSILRRAIWDYQSVINETSDKSLGRQLSDRLKSKSNQESQLLKQILQHVRSMSRQCRCTLETTCESCTHLLEAKKKINLLSNIEGFKDL